MNYPWLDEYLFSKKAVKKDFKAEWQWERYQIGNKLFAAICYGEEGRQLLMVKCEPEFGEYLRENYRDITPGYYMNKVHWNSVNLNGNVPESFIKEMIEQSYEPVLNSFSKKSKWNYWKDKLKDQAGMHRQQDAWKELQSLLNFIK